MASRQTRMGASTPTQSTRKREVNKLGTDRKRFVHSRWSGCSRWELRRRSKLRYDCGDLSRRLLRLRTRQTDRKTCDFRRLASKAKALLINYAFDAGTGVGCFTFNSMCRSRSCLGAVVAAGIPACRRAGLPSPAEKTSRIAKRVETFVSRRNIGRSFRAARMPALHVRHRCLTLRTSPSTRSADRGVVSARL